MYWCSSVCSVQRWPHESHSYGEVIQTCIFTGKYFKSIWHFALIYWWCQPLAPIVKFYLNTLCKHSILILMHSRTLSKTFVSEVKRYGSSYSWLTIQWKRLKYKLLNCFTPYGVKWKWDELCRHSSVCLKLKHNGALESGETEVTELREYHQHSFITHSFFF